VEANNLCVRTLIFDCFSFIAFLSEFFLLFICPFSLFCDLMFYCLFPFFGLVFYHHSFPTFSPLFYLCFLTHVVSSLAYPNLLGTKRLGYCCCTHLFWVDSHSEDNKIIVDKSFINSQNRKGTYLQRNV
jgi:hypothetical protein